MNLEKERNWKFYPNNPQKTAEIAGALSVHPKIAAVMVNRGIDSVELAVSFMHGGIEQLYNPFIFPDMQKAVERIKSAINGGEAILIYGDRDVDGITAVNVMVNTIRELGGNAQWYVPADEGYGIHKDILTKYAAEGVKLLITVDCGISAFEEIKYANGLGIDVILTDHHEPPYEGVPEAYAVINPKSADSPYPFKDIAGCTVALKTAQVLMTAFSKEYNKEIVICYAEQKESDFSGFYVKLKNDINTGQDSFSGISGIKSIFKQASKVYTNNKELKDAVVKNDALLKDRIEIFVIHDFAGDENFEKKVLRSCKIKRNNEDLRMKKFFKDNLDLCALGTIADSMPLIDENRIIVKKGLEIIDSNPNARPGLGLLIEDTLVSRNIQYINSRSISWNVTPMLNSSGRMGRGMLSAQLLMTSDAFQAKNLYADIVKLNGDRRWLQSENVEQFNLLLNRQCDLKQDKVLIVDAANLEHGVTGIVASQMVKNHMKPAFLLISDGNEAIGAARSVPGFDLIAALESVKDILVKYGGHSQAAGFTVSHANIEEFKRRIKEHAEKHIVDFDPCESIEIDGELKISDISLDFYKQLDILEPFGMQNQRPVFCLKGVSVTEVAPFGSKYEHVKFKVSQHGSRNVQAVFWNHGDYSEMLRNENLVDIAFHMDIVGRNDKQIAQLCVIDVKPTY
ncbi:MAG: single-stranded-DNA-specific exonuclease RecJ [Endomicrobia bacterium]|nr:single-stranded-DNA-specific exonuclease RecJ [Endomicrobiia bacterium]MCL2145313.1 single-stranded-DNA-specific exonuclease RecJ [Endomicrobiia bacterium]